MKRLMEYIRPCLWRMAGGFSIKFMGSLLDLMIPWMLSKIIDDVIPTGEVRMILLWGGLSSSEMFTRISDTLTMVTSSARSEHSIGKDGEE